MKVSVVVNDKTVVVDNVGVCIPDNRWPSPPDNVWAYQWDGSTGTTETITSGELNTAFSNISTVQPYVDIHATLLSEATAAKQAEADAFTTKLEKEATARNTARAAFDAELAAAEAEAAKATRE